MQKSIIQLACQIVDDILDFTSASATLGKPAQADMELGLATAPILLASEQRREIRPLIERRFKVLPYIAFMIKTVF